jgi:hypothetical protein
LTSWPIRRQAARIRRRKSGNALIDANLDNDELRKRVEELEAAVAERNLTILALVEPIEPPKAQEHKHSSMCVGGNCDLHGAQEEQPKCCAGKMSCSQPMYPPKAGPKRCGVMVETRLIGDVPCEQFLPCKEHQKESEQ